MVIFVKLKISVRYENVSKSKAFNILVCCRLIRSTKWCVQAFYNLKEAYLWVVSFELYINGQFDRLEEVCALTFLTSNASSTKADVSKVGLFITHWGTEVIAVMCSCSMVFLNSDRWLISATSIDEIDDCEGDLSRVETFPVETL